MARCAALNASSVACHFARPVSRVLRAPVLEPGGLHDEQLRRLVAEHHLGDHVLHELVAPDRLAERLTLARVLHGSLEAGPDDAEAPAATVKRPWSSEYIAISKPWPSSPIRFGLGHLAVLEEELAGRAGPDAELVLDVGGREPGRALLDDEGGDALVPGLGVGLREHERVVGHGGVRDPVLLSVEDVRVARPSQPWCAWQRHPSPPPAR